MENMIVKYHNNVHTASLRRFNAKELDILMALMSRMRDKGEDVVVFSFDYLKKLVNWTDDNDSFVRMLDNTYRKLIECHIKVGNDEEWTRFVLFHEYTISKKKSEISISVHNKFKFVLNILTSNFTRFELDEFLSFRSSYTKEFYRRMKQFKNTGIWKVSLEEFRRVMDIPQKYPTSAIDKFVLAPIITELGGQHNLKITKLYKKDGRGRPSVCGFEFSFLKEGDRETEISSSKSYVRDFYRCMKQFANTGIWEVSLDEFKKVMDIPEKYNIGAIDKFVLAPIKAEFGEKYSLKVTKLFAKGGRGRPSVCGFEFSFSLAGVGRHEAETPDVAEKEPVSVSEVTKEPKHNMEFDEMNYVGRTLRVRDKITDQFNYLKIKFVECTPDGKVNVDVQNADDDYRNTLYFNSVKIWDRYFEKHVV